MKDKWKVIITIFGIVGFFTIGLVLKSGEQIDCINKIVCDDLVLKSGEKQCFFVYNRDVREYQSCGCLVDASIYNVKKEDFKGDIIRLDLCEFMRIMKLEVKNG